MCKYKIYYVDKIIQIINNLSESSDEEEVANFYNFSISNEGMIFMTSFSPQGTLKLACTEIYASYMKIIQSASLSSNSKNRPIRVFDDAK